jgi:hypothetical protein
MELWLTNIDPAASDDDVRELVKKYSQLEILKLKREAGDGSRPGVILEFAADKRDEVYNAQRRLNGLYWKNRAITAYIPLHTGGAKS